MVSIRSVGSQQTSVASLRGERVEFPSRRGSALVGDLYRAGGGPAGASSGRWLVLCHGMESTRGGTKQTAVVERFVPKGYSVLRFDFSYVGESEGAFADLTVSGEVADTLGALDFLAEFEPRDVTLVGSSLGGLVALLAVSQAPHLVRRAATMAAVADTALFTDRLSEAEIADWRSEGRRSWGDGHLNVGFLEDALGLDARSAIARICRPILAVHGADDEVVPVEHGRLIARSLPEDAELSVFEGVGHRFEEPGALDRLLQTIEDWLGRQHGSNGRA